jgi:hypothetical protein
LVLLSILQGGYELQQKYRSDVFYLVTRLGILFTGDGPILKPLKEKVKDNNVG